MRLWIPSTSRSDEPNIRALRERALFEGIELADASQKPDCAILLGDRIEMLSVARVCLTYYVPWVHVGAGCVTEGSWDQTVRDMLTRGAKSCWAYTDNARDHAELRNFCEWLVTDSHGYGVPVLDTLAPRGFEREDYVLVAINPVTAKNVGEELALVDEIAEACTRAGREVIWSAPNEDPQSRELYDKMARTWPGQSLADKVLPFSRAIEECYCIVGNSSAALIEAPVLGTPFVDCGCRQYGRPFCQSLRGEFIYDGIKNAVPTPLKSPYQHPERKACEKIMELCREVADE